MSPDIKPRPSYGNIPTMPPPSELPDESAGFARVGQLLRAGQANQALELARQLRGSPAAGRYATTLLAGAKSLSAAGRYRQAISTLAECLLFLPDNQPTLVSMSAVLGAAGRWVESADAATLALNHDPQCVEALVNRAIARHRTGDLDGADDDTLRAIATRSVPDQAFMAAMLARAAVLHDTARSAEAVGLMELAVARWPHDPNVVGNYLYALHFPDNITAEHIAREHSLAASRLFADTARKRIPHRRTTAPLRVGIVSADFRDHPVTRFLTKWVGHLDRRQIELIAYCDSRTTDARTTKLSSMVFGWRDISGAADPAVAEQMRQDQIDILVDLSGHLHTPRLSLFARGAAPVQLTYLGYPDTTGLVCFDGKITDDTLDPVGSERLYTEPLLRLPVSAWCYDDDDLPAIASVRPFQRGGQVTFGMLNAPAKFSQSYLLAVARILRLAPTTRLLIKAPGQMSQCRQFASTVLQAADEVGIDPDRVQIISRPGSRAEYLQLFNQIDIALDSFPFGGHTTAFETLLMGVPMIAMQGDRHAGRWHTSLMHATGISDLIASDPAGYVAAAVRLAADTPRLGTFGLETRRRLVEAGYCNGPEMAEKFTRLLLNLHRSTLYPGLL